MKCRVASAKKLDKERCKAVNKTSAAVIASMLHVCEHRLHFGYDKMRWVARHINSQFDLVNQDYMKFEDFAESLHDYFGVDIPFDMKTVQQCNTIDDARRIADYTQKAFACAILCTILCEKFEFGAKKSQQAVKQFCETFEQFKKDRTVLAAYEKHLLKDIQIGLHVTKEDET